MVGITLGVIALGVYWIVPVALSFNAARNAPLVARVVPTDLKDLSVSQTLGTKLFYVGYEFEIPWDDLDESQTKQVPKGSSNPFMVALKFRSGRSLLVSASPPRVFVDSFTKEYRASRDSVDRVFGESASRSDYDFRRNL